MMGEACKKNPRGGSKCKHAKKTKLKGYAKQQRKRADKARKAIKKNRR